MRRRKPSDDALELWRSLARGERVTAVAAAARHFAERGRYRSLGDGVSGVGFGFREKRVRARAGARERSAGWTRQVRRSEPVLDVFVEKKWRKSSKEADPSRAVPRWVEVEVQLAGKFRRIAVPTDVVAERAAPRAQSAVIAKPTPGSPNDSVLGTACCAVRDEPDSGARYLLGCHHVLCRSKVLPALGTDATAEIHEDRSAQKVRIGVATRPARFGKNVVASIDAALAELDDNGVALIDGGFLTFQPDAYAADESELLALVHGGVRLHVRSGKPIAMRYLRTRFRQPVKYDSAEAEIAEVIVCESKSSRQPIPGDSGGALSAQTALVAMHIAGMGSLSYAIPAYQLLLTDTFGDPITLA